MPVNGKGTEHARRLIFSFRGTTLTPFLREKLERGLAGGVILFSGNIESPDQVRELTTRVRSLSPYPVIISIDQEGGRVQRIRWDGWVLPSAREMGKTMSPREIEQRGRHLGRKLSEVGVNVNFAPVLDVSGGDEGTVIGDRSFGETPEEVIRCALPFSEGLSRGGVIPVGKHFPGHGVTDVDSHVELPRSSISREELQQVHLPPFGAFVRRGFPALMTAHVVYEALDPERPATFSRVILEDLLREKLGFQGVTFSDDLKMAAVKSNYSFREIAEMTVEGGPDFLIFTGPEEEQGELLEEVIRAGRRKPEAGERIIQRVLRFLSLLPRP
ncbi:MAG: beta-N-acetylhexosaminidase [Deltaproteobacteria bacterium]|nr:MAG: beta-N-acetylhexosaminidase [Deltaproteobacteria bacterium]